MKSETTAMSKITYPDYDVKIIKQINQISICFKTNLRILKDEKYYLVPYNETFILSENLEGSKLEESIININRLFASMVYEKIILYIPDEKNGQIDASQISEKERILDIRKIYYAN